MKKITALLAFITLTACNDRRDEEAIARITDLLREDFRTAYINDDDVTNSVNLLQPAPPEAQEIVVVELYTDMPTIDIQGDELPLPAYHSNTQPSTPQHTPAAQHTANAQNTAQEVIINIGEDKSGISVSRRQQQKITTAVFRQKDAASVDIYLFAIPVCDALVRNYNTLIGYAKAIDFIGGHAQFTKYWNGYRLNGQPPFGARALIIPSVTIGPRTVRCSGPN